MHLYSSGPIPRMGLSSLYTGTELVSLHAVDRLGKVGVEGEELFALLGEASYL